MNTKTKNNEKRPDEHNDKDLGGEECSDEELELVTGGVKCDVHPWMIRSSKVPLNKT